MATRTAAVRHRQPARDLGRRAAADIRFRNGVWSPTAAERGVGGLGAAMAARNGTDPRGFWDAAATEDAIWYVATGASGEEAFFALGAEETDFFLRLCGIPLSSSAVVVEIGCGPGRMTARFAQLAGRVVATDVSGEMLERCRKSLSGRDNVDYVLLPGDGELTGIPDGSADVVFSYITLQHVPDAQAQLRYLAESARVLRPGGRAAIQVRATGWRAVAHDWAGHLAHFAAGRRTLRVEWRGSRLTRADILRTVEAAGATAELIPHGHRHLWVALRKLP